jgi:hypothetical protein
MVFSRQERPMDYSEYVRKVGFYFYGPLSRLKGFRNYPIWRRNLPFYLR